MLEAVPVAITMGGFNADGHLDLATPNASGTVSILLGQGNGTFQAAPDVIVRDFPVSATVGDCNADGRLDLAVTTGNPSVGFTPCSIFSPMYRESL